MLHYLVLVTKDDTVARDVTELFMAHGVNLSEEIGGLEVPCQLKIGLISTKCNRCHAWCTLTHGIKLFRWHFSTRFIIASKSISTFTRSNSRATLAPARIEI